VGRTIRGRSRAGEFRDVLAEIVSIADDRSADLVLVAGDLFDTAAPSPDAERQVYGTLLDLVETGADVVVIAGNHDNHRRLGAVEPLLGLTRIHTGASLKRPDQGGVLHIETSSGEVARVALLPFLSQRGIVKADALMADDAVDHSGAYAERCRSIIDGLCAGFTGDAVNVLLAHLTVAGGQVGGGERMAHTIFDYHVPPQVFPATAHYVALGHLHRPQKLPAAAPTWYSGSPLHLDFGEAPGDKVVLLVEAGLGAPATVEQVALSAGRRLRTVTGTVDQLEAQRDELGDDYLRVVVDEPSRVGLADEVRGLLPHAVDVSVTRPDDGDPSADRPTWDLQDFQRSPDELFAEYLDSEGMQDDALLTRFRELLEEVHATDPA